MALTRDLGRFIAELKYEHIPQAARDVAKLGFLDCLGVMVAGSAEEVTRILQGTLMAAAGPGRSSLYLSKQKAPALLAAWINGTAAHALDYDDAGGHRSAILVPAIMAEAEAIGASGRDMITAYITGFEAWSEMVRREPGHLHEKGWHPTGIYGAVAASAAIAKLHGLPAEQCAIAIGIGASQAAGVVANFGTMVKPFHAGSSARAGVLAGQLAKAGMTASTAALEHERGLLSAASQHGGADRSSPADGLGRTWTTAKLGVSIKKFPTCYCTHRSIDAMLAILARQPFTAADVADIEVALGKTQAAILINHEPRTGLAAKFSIEFAMASAILVREVGLTQLTDKFVLRDDVQKLLRKVRTRLIEEYDPNLTSYSPFDEVTVRLTSGEVLSEKVTRARGHISRPLERSELFKKFADCLAFGHSDLDPEGAFAAIEQLETNAAGWVDQLPRRAAGGTARRAAKA